MIVGISMMRDEADICGHVITHLLNEGVDRIIVGENMSRDATPAILAGFDEVTVVRDLDPGYHQHTKMTRYARMAAEMGAEWILPFDADECWYWPDGTLAEFFAQCPASVVYGHGWDHLVRASDDPLDPNPLTRITHRRTDPQKLPKVAFRPCEAMFVDFGNHDVFLDPTGDQSRMAHHPGPKVEGLEYRHFQYRSFEHMARKVRDGAAAQNLADLHPMYGTHWRSLALLSDDDLRAKWDALCNEEGLVIDPAPYRP